MIAFSFPVVPSGKARIRTQISATHTRDELERAVQPLPRRKHDWVKTVRFQLPVATGLLLMDSPAPAQVTHNDWFPGSSSISEVEIIPPGFRGKWAPSLSNCADQDGVDHMYIYPNGIDFYESGGRLERITQAGQEFSVRMKLAFEGEGRFWDQIWTATLSPDRNRVTMASEDGSNPEIYVRCPQN